MAVVVAVLHAKVAEEVEGYPFWSDGQNSVVCTFSCCRRKGCLEHVKLARGPARFSRLHSSASGDVRIRLFVTCKIDKSTFYGTAIFYAYVFAYNTVAAVFV